MKKILLLLLLALPCFGFGQSKKSLSPFDYYCWGLKEKPSVGWLLRATAEEYEQGYIDYSSICNTNVELQDLTPTLVVFWSHICGPAVKAIDAIYDKMAQWQSEMNFQVMIVEISNSKYLSRIKSMCDGRGWNKKMIDVYNVRSAYEESDFKVENIPYYQVFDGNWDIKHESFGYSKTGDQIHTLYHVLKDTQ